MGTKAANTWGLKDMHGNVMEWVSDWYGPYPDGAAVDPTGPETGRARGVRGGAHDFTARFVRSAARYRKPPASRSAYIGFRCAAR